MQNNPQLLTGVIVVLILIVAYLGYDRYQARQTLGDKVGQSIDRAAGDVKAAIDGRR